MLEAHANACPWFPLLWVTFCDLKKTHIIPCFGFTFFRFSLHQCKNLKCKMWSDQNNFQFKKNPLTTPWTSGLLDTRDNTCNTNTVTVLISLYTCKVRTKFKLVLIKFEQFDYRRVVINTAFKAPLALNDPVFWKLSALKNTFLPTILSSVELVTTGHSWTYGEIFSLASKTSLNVITLLFDIFFSNGSIKSKVKYQTLKWEKYRNNACRSNFLYYHFQILWMK